MGSLHEIWDYEPKDDLPLHMFGSKKATNIVTVIGLLFIIGFFVWFFWYVSNV